MHPDSRRLGNDAEFREGAGVNDRPDTMGQMRLAYLASADIAQEAVQRYFITLRQLPYFSRFVAVTDRKTGDA